MRILNILAPAAIALGLTASGAHAAVLVMAGDADCFGETEAECTAGFLNEDTTAPVNPPSFNNNTAGDPAGTDVFDVLGAVTLNFNLDLAGATATSANLTVRFAGLDVHVETTSGDAVEGAGFAFNSTLVGTYFEPAVSGDSTFITDRKINTLVFSINIASLVDGGVNTLVISPEFDFGFDAFEAFAVDYALLTVETESVGASVPLPAPVALLAGALGILGFASRRKSRSA